VCSKGTYIRALARDLGIALGSGAHLTSLKRTRVGKVRIEDCLSVDDAVKKISETDLSFPES
ncbi:MAG: tRNA pseudouridine(55) synthase, partial [Muribaculaceae bacterium]|nr:tRNA pseudouridine(55) synthase [Muribaculaceae bacterium]